MTGPLQFPNGLRLLTPAMTAVAVVTLLASCGAPKVYKGPPPTTTTTPKPAGPVDLSARGKPMELGTSIEVVGYQTVWLRGTRLLVTLEQTSWDEIAGDREGRARLAFDLDGEKSKATIDEGETHTWKGFTFRVLHADEKYIDDKGTWEPHARFEVSR